MRDTWTLAVFGLMYSSAPISRFVRPDAMSRRTSSSRSVSPSRSTAPASASPERAPPRSTRPRRASATTASSRGRAPSRAAVDAAARSGSAARWRSSQRERGLRTAPARVRAHGDDPERVRTLDRRRPRGRVRRRGEPGPLRIAQGAVEEHLGGGHARRARRRAPRSPPPARRPGSLPPGRPAPGRVRRGPPRRARRPTAAAPGGTRRPAPHARPARDPPPRAPRPAARPTARAPPPPRRAGRSTRSTRPDRGARARARTARVPQPRAPRTWSTRPRVPWARPSTIPPGRAAIARSISGSASSRRPSRISRWAASHTRSARYPPSSPSARHASMPSSATSRASSIRPVWSTQSAEVDERAGDVVGPLQLDGDGQRVAQGGLAARAVAGIRQAEPERVERVALLRARSDAARDGERLAAARGRLVPAGRAASGAARRRRRPARARRSAARRASRSSAAR